MCRFRRKLLPRRDESARKMQEEAALLFVTKGWDVIVILQLLSVMDNCAIKKELHYSLAARYHGISLLFKLSIIILSASSAIICLVPTSNDAWIKLTTGILSVITTALASVVTAMGYDELSENHRSAYSGFEAVQRGIQDEVSRHDSEPWDEFVQQMNEMLKELTDKAPFIDDFMILDIPITPLTEVNFLGVIELVPKIAETVKAFTQQPRV